MLVLSRKIHESILIDNRIEITVTEVAGGRVRLGISAPRDVPIQRGEHLDEFDDGFQPRVCATEVAATASPCVPR